MEEICWQGPFSWPGFEQTNRLTTMPDIKGVYLHSFEYNDGYILCSPGITTSTRKRFSQHTRAFFKGKYNVLDIEAAKIGKRKEIWHGWGYAKAHQDEFEQRKEFILQAVNKQLLAYRLFIAEVSEERKRERIEAAIMISIYASKGTCWNNIADEGMHKIPRKDWEILIELRNCCDYKIYGLPVILEV